ncbi:MAG: hypothetical protein CRN43_04265 [Candidatus Nephrothrix sp. EaCA]|nr:MAG: hypothetical protein CRN43_04265 [Candidatus Nephrothrix sp. EaCA]
MKKLLPLIFFIIIGLSANAQRAEHGFAIGYNFAWMKTKETNSGNTSVSAPISSVTLGWYFRFFVSKKWSLQPEAMFVTYGGTLPDKELRLGYFALSVPLRWNITPGIFAFTGLQGGILSGRRDKSAYSYYNRYCNCKTYPYKKAYSSLVLGGGYSFRESGLEASIRYHLGLSDIHEAVAVETRLNAFQLVLTARIGVLKQKL